MMKKSVLHYVADDPDGLFKNNEEAQFEMLLSLISDYHVNEEITFLQTRLDEQLSSSFKEVYS